MKACCCLQVGLTVLLVLGSSFSQNSSEAPPDGFQTARVVSVRQLKQTSGFPMSRYPTVARFTLDVAFRIDGQSYCTDYETPVLDEVHELIDANGRDVKVEIHGKRITIILPSGRRIRTDMAKETQC
jgi:hypothetical protein